MITESPLVMSTLTPIYQAIVTYGQQDFVKTMIRLTNYLDLIFVMGIVIVWKHNCLQMYSLARLYVGPASSHRILYCQYGCLSTHLDFRNDVVGDE